jgi:hypothetical protein
MKAFSCALEALAMLGTVGAAWSAGPEAAVQVAGSSTRIAGDHAVVEITLRNTSRSTVTAWAYSIEAHYADGSKRCANAMVDDISALLGTDSDARAFRMSTVRSFSATLPLDANGNAPVSAVTTLKMAALDDRSALGDDSEIRHLEASRRSQAASMTKMLDDIERVRKSDDPKAALRALIADQSAKPNQLSGTPQPIALLQLVPLVDQGPAALDRVVSMYRSYRDLLLQHSALKPLEEPK